MKQLTLKPFWASLAALSLLVGMAGGAGAQTTQTYPITSVSLQGAFSNPGQTPGRSCFRGRESQIAFSFVGTEAEFLLTEDTGYSPYPGQSFTVIIDGVSHDNQVQYPGFTAPAPANLWQNITYGLTLTDGPHTAIIQIALPSYTSTDNWGIDNTTSVRITGANPACSLPASRVVSGGKIAVLVGDSKTEGFDCSAGDALAMQGGTSYPADFVGLLSDSTWTVVNQGSYGDVASHLLSRQPEDVLSQFNAANTRNVLCYWPGINDLNSGVAAASVEQTAVSYLANAKTAGVKERIIGTLSYVSGQGSHDDQIAAYNADVRANWQTKYGATGLADIDADSVFSSHAASSYWASDNLHHTDSGYAKVAADFYTAFANQVFTAPSLALSFTEAISSSGVTFTAAGTGGSGTLTYSLKRSSSPAGSFSAILSNTSGSLTDPSPLPGVVNYYTLSVTDSEATPVTKTLTQAVVPLGPFTALPLVPTRQPSRGR